MKILCVNCTISEFGGVEFAAINLARKLADRGHEVHVLGASGVRPQLQPKGEVADQTPTPPSDCISTSRSFPEFFRWGNGTMPFET